MNNRTKNKKRIYTIIIILLFFAMIALTANHIIKKIKDKNIPTFDIACNNEKCSSKTSLEGNNETKDHTVIAKEKNNQNNQTTIEQQTNQGGEVEYGDNKKRWVNNDNVDIFDIDSVKPGDSGKYDFYVNNNTTGGALYNVTFDEQNDYNANIMYRLKRNETYISGNNNEWVYYYDLQTSGNIINNNQKDLYTLEWKWIDSDNDTAVGVAAATEDKVVYNLNIKIEAIATDIKKDIINPNTVDSIIYYATMLVLSFITFFFLYKIGRIRKHYEQTK